MTEPEQRTSRFRRSASRAAIPLAVLLGAFVFAGGAVAKGDSAVPTGAVVTSHAPTVPANPRAASKGTEDTRPLTGAALDEAREMEAMDPLTTAIDGAIRRDHLVGFASMRNDIATVTLDLYWHGPVPDQIRAIHVPKGVTLVIHESRFTLDAEKRAATNVLNGWNSDSKLADSGLWPQSIDMNPDGSGITVYLASRQDPARIPAVPEGLGVDIQTLAGDVTVTKLEGAQGGSAALSAKA